MWNAGHTFAASNDAAIDLMVRSAQSYLLLRPPAVSAPLLVIQDQLNAPVLVGELATRALTASVIESEFVCTRLPVEIGSYYGLPDRTELLRAKWLASTAGTRVVLYAAETFGGACEYEWAWLINGHNGEEHVQVLVEEPSTNPTRWRRIGISSTVARDLEGGSMMEDVLIFLGVRSRGGFFEPFTRGFDWKRYEVPASSRP
jgi:hypothetical protein